MPGPALMAGLCSQVRHRATASLIAERRDHRDHPERQHGPCEARRHSGREQRSPVERLLQRSPGSSRRWRIAHAPARTRPCRLRSPSRLDERRTIAVSGRTVRATCMARKGSVWPLRPSRQGSSPGRSFELRPARSGLLHRPRRAQRWEMPGGAIGGGKVWWRKGSVEETRCRDVCFPFFTSPPRTDVTAPYRPYRPVMPYTSDFVVFAPTPSEIRLALDRWPSARPWS